MKTYKNQHKDNKLSIVQLLQLILAISKTQIYKSRGSCTAE